MLLMAHYLQICEIILPEGLAKLSDRPTCMHIIEKQNYHSKVGYVADGQKSMMFNISI